MVGAMLFEADASAADFTDANLAESWMGRIRLLRATLDGADFTYADLGGASLGDSSMRNTILSLASLQFARLFRADLSGAYGEGTFLPGAEMRRANLTGATFVRSNFFEAESRRCQPDQRRFFVVDDVEGESREHNSDGDDLHRDPHARQQDPPLRRPSRLQSKIGVDRVEPHGDVELVRAVLQPGQIGLLAGFGKAVDP